MGHINLTLRAAHLSLPNMLYTYSCDTQGDLGKLVESYEYVHRLRTALETDQHLADTFVLMEKHITNHR